MLRKCWLSAAHLEVPYLFTVVTDGLSNGVRVLLLVNWTVCSTFVFLLHLVAMQCVIVGPKQSKSAKLPKHAPPNHHRLRTARPARAAGGSPTRSVAAARPTLLRAVRPQ